MREGGHGCHVIAATFLDHLGDRVCGVVTQRYLRRLAPRSVAATFTQPFLWHPGGSRIGLRRFVPELAEVVSAIMACATIFFHRRRLTAWRPDRIFLMLGSSGWHLIVGLWARRILGIPLDVYIVDDLEESARLHQRHLMARVIAKLQSFSLASADRVFGITPALCAHLATHCARHPQWLPVPLPALPSDPPSPDHAVTNEIVYAGGVNFLYTDALVDFYASLADWNASHPSRRLTLHLITYTPDFVLGELFPDRSHLQVTYKPSPRVMRELASGALALLLPYSRKSDVRRMVETSFPSKMGEYFPARRPILVYGPAYGSSVSYFRDHALPLVATEPDELPALLAELFAAKDGRLLSDYARVYEELHSPRALISRLEGDTSHARDHEVPA
jgi:hypothetical protein